MIDTLVVKRLGEDSRGWHAMITCVSSRVSGNELHVFGMESGDVNAEMNEDLATALPSCDILRSLIDIYRHFIA